MAIKSVLVNGFVESKSQRPKSKQPPRALVRKEERNVAYLLFIQTRKIPAQRLCPFPGSLVSFGNLVRLSLSVIELGCVISQRD